MRRIGGSTSADGGGGRPGGAGSSPGARMPPARTASDAPRRWGVAAGAPHHAVVCPINRSTRSWCVKSSAGAVCPSARRAAGRGARRTARPWRGARHRCRTARSSATLGDALVLRLAATQEGDESGRIPPGVLLLERCGGAPRRTRPSAGEDRGHQLAPVGKAAIQVAFPNARAPPISSSDALSPRSANTWTAPVRIASRLRCASARIEGGDFAFGP